MNRPDRIKLYFKDTSFASLMTQRIYNILLVLSMMRLHEEDGRIDEQIFNDFTKSSLSSSFYF